MGQQCGRACVFFGIFARFGSFAVCLQRQSSRSHLSHCHKYCLSKVSLDFLFASSLLNSSNDKFVFLLLFFNVICYSIFHCSCYHSSAVCSYRRSSILVTHPPSVSDTLQLKLYYLVESRVVCVYYYPNSFLLVQRLFIIIPLSLKLLYFPILSRNNFMCLILWNKLIRPYTSPLIGHIILSSVLPVHLITISFPFLSRPHNFFYC